MLRRSCLVAFAFPAALIAQEPDRVGRLPVDRSRPVPARADVIAAWQKRQDAINNFRFSWTEDQTHPTGWLSNPRYPERERSAIPALFVDRNYVVAKRLLVGGNRMIYSLDLDRKAEADGVEIIAPQGGNRGLGVRRHYSYWSVFDGQTTTTRILSRLGPPPPTVTYSTANIDAQNVDARPIMMAFRPLDPVMGHRLIDRAVTNLSRTIYKGRSIFLLEERHDPSGWKTILWIEPERDFLVARYLVLFEQRTIVDIDIDYTRDARWGWIPSAWRVTEMLSDGSKRLVSTARVTSYNINQPIEPREFSRD